MRSPRWRTPQVAMIQGRRAGEGEVPIMVLFGPPTPEEAQGILVVFRAIRSGAFVVENLPGARHRESLRVRGLDPPRQGKDA